MRLFKFPRVFPHKIDPRKPLTGLALKLLAIGAIKNTQQMGRK